MAHFAKLDANNIVTQVIVVGNSDITDSNGDEVESIGVAFCQKLLGADTNWKQPLIIIILEVIMLVLVILIWKV